MFIVWGFIVSIGLMPIGILFYLSIVIVDLIVRIIFLLLIVSTYIIRTLLFLPNCYKTRQFFRVNFLKRASEMSLKSILISEDAYY